MELGTSRGLWIWSATLYPLSHPRHPLMIKRTLMRLSEDGVKPVMITISVLRRKHIMNPLSLLAIVSELCWSIFDEQAVV